MKRSQVAGRRSQVAGRRSLAPGTWHLAPGTWHLRPATCEELAEIKERGARLGPEHIKAVEAEWPRLIAQVRREMIEGRDPTSDRVRPLANRWRELVREFTGGNPSIERKVHASYAEDPIRAQRAGLDPAVCAYVARAIRALDA